MHHLGLDMSPLLEGSDGPHPLRRAHKAFILASLGRADEARVILRAFSDLWAENDSINEWIPERFLQVAVLIGDTETLVELVPLLAPLAGRLSEAMFPGGVSWSYGRLLGEGLVLLGKPGEARELYAQGLDVGERVRFRPELALLHLDLAELLLDHYPDERTEAVQHLDFAISQLQQMKMQPALERALRRKLQLQGTESVAPSTSIHAVSLAVAAEAPDLRPHAAPDGTVTILFTDIEDSTGLTVRVGDRRWREILRVHNALVRAQLREYGGFEVKTLGDGFMAAFQSARQGVQCAVAIQRACAAESNSDGATVRMRIGLHAGDMIRDDNDFHGLHVTMAARIADQAIGGEILVSALLKDLTEGDRDLQFGEPHEVNVKGLDGTQRVYTVAWQ
jgi:eukaryotic-like serine/threonine-protein kinase